MSFELLWEFLENSTIHGLYNIATARSKLSKIVWVLTILLSFCLAGSLIHRSFTNWQKSPISTAVHTDAISSAPFPRVTVCPPKAADTALNYDLLLAKHISFTDEDRNWLEDTIVNVLRENKMAMQFFLDLAKNYGFVEIVQASRNIWDTNNSIDEMVINLITSMYIRWNITKANLPFFFADTTSNTTKAETEVSHNPIHLLSETGHTLPSCFIPYCAFGGDMAALGRRQENFTYPVCTAFEPTILDGQLCYKIDVNKVMEDVKNGVGHEAGLMFVIDLNEERALALETKKTFVDIQECEEKTHLPSRPKEVDNIKVHIDTLEPFSVFDSGIFIMTSVKEMKGTTNFLEMADDVRKCGLEDYVQDCKNRNDLVNKLLSCNCTPSELVMLIENYANLPLCKSYLHTAITVETIF